MLLRLVKLASLIESLDVRLMSSERAYQVIVFRHLRWDYLPLVRLIARY